MRILIDATSVLLRSAGVKSYTYHWIEHLRRAAQCDRILAFPFLGDLGALTHERSVLGFASTYARLALLYFVNAPGNPAIDWLAAGADVFHVSNQIRNPPRRTRLTATVHDMTCRLMPELHTPANVRADQSFADHVLKRAAGLIAVSENTKRDAVRVLNMDPDKIEVIYSGVSEAYFNAKPTPSARPYVLFLGTIEPRKNIGALLDAWEQLDPELRAAYDLVIAGASGWSSESTLARLRSGIGGVRYIGYTPESQLPALTAGATAFVYPSLYEGFGFPVAQAMACGVPVVTSAVSSLPEVAGDAALLVDPRSAGEIASALSRVLQSPELQQRLGEAGRRRAQAFRWDTCARRSLEFFRSLA
jgi:glycosyltransferase involved in cell wall biosynthesis